MDFDPGDEATAEETYAVALADNLADLSDCQDRRDLQKPDCARPASLTQDLEETINVELLLDACGSMADAARGGTKMQVAQRVLGDFVETLPANANVSLRIFGHEGTGSGPGIRAKLIAWCPQSSQRNNFADSAANTSAKPSSTTTGMTIAEGPSPRTITSSIPSFS